MRIFLAVVLILGLGLLIGVAAQDHSNGAEKKMSDELTITQAVKVAGNTLEPGRYRVSCDRENMTFDRLEGKRLRVTVPCKGKQLPHKITTTELRIENNGEGRVVTAVLLRGSDIEHTF